MIFYIKEANEFFSQGMYCEAHLIYRKAQDEYPGIKDLFEINIKICKDMMERDRKNSAVGDEIFITMTTIKSRLYKLLPVIESLHKQTLLPKKIYLNLSEAPYLLDEGVKKEDPYLKKLLDYPLLEINWTENIGPYRKIVPFLNNFFNQKNDNKKEIVFITVDDDTLYPDYFVDTLYKKYIEHDCVVAFRGRYITATDRCIAPYRDWELGKETPSVNNLPTGKDGILYSTKFFNMDFVDMNAATMLAPTADDLWIKWHCGLNGVKALIINPEAATSDYKSFPLVDYSGDYRDNSLYKVHNADSSGSKNDESIAKMENYFSKKSIGNLYSLLEK